MPLLGCLLLLAPIPDAPTTRELLFYGPRVRAPLAAALAVFHDDPRLRREILERAARGELGPAGYPPGLFGWIVGRGYDPTLLAPLRRLLVSPHRESRILAVTALETLLGERWSPPRGPVLLNPGQVWWLRRLTARLDPAGRWQPRRLWALLRRLPPAVRGRALAFFVARGLLSGASAGRRTPAPRGSWWVRGDRPSPGGGSP